MNVRSIRTGDIEEVAGNDAAIISTTDNDVNVVCFVSGTTIETPDGPVPIEDLRVGDKVVTRDHGPQEVRLILVRELDFTPETETLKPISFAPNSLGAGRPCRRLCVSPQHRMLVTNAAGTELLVPAKSLTDRKGVRVMTGKRRVTYFHLVFDRHEIIMSNGTFTESFFPGPVALASIPKATRDEVLDIFGLKAGHPPIQPPMPAAPMCRFQDARKLAKTFSAARTAGKTDARPGLSCASRDLFRSQFFSKDHLHTWLVSRFERFGAAGWLVLLDGVRQRPPSAAAACRRDTGAICLAPSNARCVPRGGRPETGAARSGMLFLGGGGQRPRVGAQRVDME
ncbi:MAG: Hint domain-containing protein [Rhodovulum sp.]